MKYENKKWRPVAYVFKSLNKAKRNYKIYNKKISRSIKAFLRRS